MKPQAGRIGGDAGRAILSYAAAAALIWWLCRGIRLSDLESNFGRADLSLFLPVTIATFFCWFFGENLLYSRLFSLFHAKTTFREMLPISAAFYFLQIINGGLAAGVLIFLMQKRKGVPWLEGGFAMLFMSMIDFQIILLMTLLASKYIGRVPLDLPWRYLIIATLLWWLTVWFWLRGRPAWEPARRIYDWAPMSCFRKARFSDFLYLMLIRAPIFLMQGMSLYLTLMSFGVHVPLGYVLAVNPGIILVKSLPITPLGLGSEQAAAVLSFQSFCPRGTLLAMSLAASTLGLFLRLGAGVFAAPALAGFKAPFRSASE